MTRLFTDTERANIGSSIDSVLAEQALILKVEASSPGARRVLVAMFLASKQRAHQQAFADEALALLGGMGARSFAGYVGHLTAIGCVVDSFGSRTGQMYFLDPRVVEAIESVVAAMPTANAVPAPSPYQDLFASLLTDLEA